MMSRIAPRCLPLAGILALAACRPGPAASGEDTGDTEGTGDDTDTTPPDTGPNAAPPTPKLLSPADGTIDVGIQAELCWEPVEDPDGDDVMYRVFVDDIELADGIHGDGGFEGPCTGPLDLVFDRTYEWEVQAFEASRPQSQSALSERWSFHTVWDGESKVLFEEEFEGELEWELGGDATTGAWVHGEPEYTEHKPSLLVTVLSQPGGCATGSGCVFTGHNPGGVSDEEDVSGGSTVLVSPPFDLSGSQSVAVSWSRFFYKSETEQTGASLEVALLVPDDQEPGGYGVFPLEELELGETLEDSNLWTPVAHPGCGVPPLEGARLRLTATDIGDGIVEAAIDSVKVIGYKNADVCQEGPGYFCDPDAVQPCPDGLICCPQGVLNEGIFRCREPVPGLSYGDPPANPEDPNNGPLGCDAPDLFVREPDVDFYVEDIFVDPDSCTLLEGCVEDSGWRTVLRFDATTPNAGSRDLVMGLPSNHPDVYHYSACHKHYHFDGYANYTLLDGADEVASGHKQAFCMVDWRSWAWPWLEGKDVGGDEGTYSCYNQGISRGWEDVYAADLDCQWVDITDVAPGDYTLRIEVNPPLPSSESRLIVERDYENNAWEMPVQVP